MALLLSLPALFVPLGLPAEGDAVDYRIPLIRWIVRHQAFPVWDWAAVDDYPALGEWLMAVFFAVNPGLGRIVPIFAYLGLGATAGHLLQIFLGNRTKISAKTMLWLGAAWGLALRPVALQSNLFMIDNLASVFFLGSLVCIFRRRVAWAGFLAALTMATRYTTWAPAACLPILVLLLSERAQRWRNIFVFSILAALGPLPFMVRNFLVNEGNPFFPIGVQGALTRIIGHYGRGTGFLDFLRFPVDLLYTNTFVNGFYDYTVGKLFYLQLLFFLLLLAVRKFRWQWPEKNSFLLLGFGFVLLVIWFLTSQQLRFLVPALVIWNIGILAFILERKAHKIVALLTILGILSAWSIQKDSALIAFGKKISPFSESVELASACFARAGVNGDTVAYVKRDSMLGFRDQDFYFIQPHTFSWKDPAPEEVRWIYTLQERPGYRRWPKEEPCLLKRI